MEQTLEKVLEKRGIKSVDELDAEEKAVFDRYSKILSTTDVTTAQVADFCRTQKSLIEAKFDLDNTPERAKDLTLLFGVYAKLINLIEGPKAERESLIRHLESQLDTPST
jgi:hypothetical protein